MGPVGPAWFSTLSLLGSGSSLVTIVSTVPLLQNTVNQQTRLSIKKTESIKTLNLSPTLEHPEKLYQKTQDRIKENQMPARWMC